MFITYSLILTLIVATTYLASNLIPSHSKLESSQVRISKNHHNLQTHHQSVQINMLCIFDPNVVGCCWYLHDPYRHAVAVTLLAARIGQALLGPQSTLK